MYSNLYAVSCSLIFAQILPKSLATSIVGVDIHIFISAPFYRLTEIFLIKQMLHLHINPAPCICFPFSYLKNILYEKNGVLKICLVLYVTHRWRCGQFFHCYPTTLLITSTISLCLDSRSRNY